MAFRNVVLGISGGVDSAVTALLLKKKGFNVTGVFMRNWDIADETGVCMASQEMEDAKDVCERLKIPFLEVNFVKEYWNNIFTTFLDEYEKGYTPNPDILCNKYIKFKEFFEYATKKLNADAIATGHYARTSFGDYLENYQPDENVKLFRPKDKVKDQTLFLSQISQVSLRRTMFPLSGLTKDEVKKMAAENGLEKVAKKPESAGICFIGYRKFQNFITDYLTPKPGKFINFLTGEVEGNHDGIHMWTIGQRCRIGSKKIPLFIVKKVPKTGDILVAPGSNHPAHYSSMFFTGEPYWLREPLDLSFKEDVSFRVQHGFPLVDCTLVEFKSKKLFGVLKRPLRALTPGQYTAFYKGEECLGSARITEVGPSEFSLGNAISPDYEEYVEEEAEESALSNRQ